MKKIQWVKWSKASLVALIVVVAGSWASPGFSRDDVLSFPTEKALNSADVQPSHDRFERTLFRAMIGPEGDAVRKLDDGRSDANLLFGSRLLVERVCGFKIQINVDHERLNFDVPRQNE